MHELTTLAWAFLFWCLQYFVSLTGVDRMVTGVIEPEIKESVFHAYALFQTWMNQAVAFMCTVIYVYSNPAADMWFALLIYWTVVYCWVGGALDAFYFMMKGEMPEWSFTWHWMPFKPKTWQYWIYAVAHLACLASAWIFKLVVM